MFWKSHSIWEPTKLENFIKTLTCSTHWNEKYLQYIVKCLEFGCIIWKSHHLKWVWSYASWIELTLRYSAFSLPNASKLKFEGNLLPKLICLRQVVFYSSCLYPIFWDLKTVKITVQKMFVEKMIKRKIGLTLTHQIANVSSLTDKRIDKFNLILIADWFNTPHIVPHFKQFWILNLSKSFSRR